MDWIIVAQLVAQYGFPVADALIKKWQNGNPVTIAEFEEVRALAQQTAADRMKRALVAASVDLDSDTAKALLGLTADKKALLEN